MFRDLETRKKLFRRMEELPSLFSFNMPAVSMGVRVLPPSSARRPWLDPERPVTLFFDENPIPQYPRAYRAVTPPRYTLDREGGEWVFRTQEEGGVNGSE